MIIKKISHKTEFIRLSITKDNQEVGRTYVYFIRNDIHKRPYAFIEDVHVEESFRGQGYGTKLMKHVHKEVKKFDCYKIVLCCKHTNPKAKNFYGRLKFKDMGTKFRIDL